MLLELQAFNGVLHAFFKSLSCMEFLANNPLLFLYFLVTDCFIYFWIQHSCKNVQLILKCLKPPFLLQFLSWLMIFLMILFIILLSMLMIQLFWENSTLFHLITQIKPLLLIWRCLSLLSRNGNVLRCQDSLSVPTWISSLTLSLFLQLPLVKLSLCSFYVVFFLWYCPLNHFIFLWSL